MIALLLCGLFAGAFAAPYYDFGPPPRSPPFYPGFHIRARPYVNDNIFDTGKFWSDLSKEMRELDDLLADFTRQFPSSISHEGVEGNEYKITIPLSGYEEKDITVKAREGLLMVQAQHVYSGGNQRNYLDARTLPDNVNVTGNWVFEQGVLKITFPLKESAKTTEVAPTSTESLEFVTTSRPYFGVSREEIETNKNDGVQDVDVGLGRGDQDKENELKTNEIPGRSQVESTTYAVDLKDEVEFVPVKYY